MLTVDQILDAPDLAEEVVEVPAWGGEVRVRAFSKAKQQELRRAATVVTIGANGKPEEDVDSAKLERLMLVAGLVDPVFSFDQADLLAEKSAGAVDTILKRILAISGLTEDAAKAAAKSGSD
jgi:hypothetical protein